MNLSAPRARLPGTPLAFGESDAKTRITNVLRYRRPALWLSAVASLVCLLAAACALTSPAQETAPEAPVPAEVETAAPETAPVETEEIEVEVEQVEVEIPEDDKKEGV